MMMSWPCSPRLALFFDFATRGSDCLTSAFGHFQSLYGHRTAQFAGQDDPGRPDLFTDHIGFFKGFEVNHVAFNLGQLMQPDLSHITLLTRVETELRQT